MTAPITNERIKILKAFFGQKLMDRLAMDAQQAKEADPNSLVQPIYVGKLIESLYRDILSILSDYPALRGENERLREQLRLANIDQLNTEAELERARPLIEAVCAPFSGTHGEWKDRIFDAAMSYRQQKEKGEGE